MQRLLADRSMPDHMSTRPVMVDVEILAYTNSPLMIA